MTKPGSERNRLVNFFQADGQRLREFVTEILGYGRNPVGSYRTLIQPSRNREHRASDRNRQKPFRTKARNAKRPSADLSASGVNWLVCSVRRKTKSSPGRTRTYDPAVNSRLLYQLSYRGSARLYSDFEWPTSQGRRLLASSQIARDFARYFGQFCPPSRSGCAGFLHGNAIAAVVVVDARHIGLHQREATAARAF